MNWNSLTQEEQLQDIIEESRLAPVLIFKHSTRCSISSTAKHRFERLWAGQNDTTKAYFLDLISYRGISNRIAEVFGVRHESPQLLLIRDGACVYHASHLSINASSVAAQLA